MNKSNLMKQAHKMTKEIKREYPEVDYKLQLGLCISYILENKKEYIKNKRRYTLIGEYNLGIGEQKHTCDHCGKVIKTVYQVKDNLNGSILEIGMVCIGKVMRLTETFDKALQKELKKYHKLLKKVNNFISAENKFEEYRELLIKQDPKFIKEHSGCVWDEVSNIHRCWTLEEFDKEKDSLIKSFNRLHEININQLERQKEKLNKLSKKGLINFK